MKKGNTGEHLGFGIVQYYNVRDADLAKSYMNGGHIDGNKVEVVLTEPRRR